MSRIMRTFYEFKDEYIIEKLEDILLKYKNDLSSFKAKISLHFSYLSYFLTRSNNKGFQYYKVSFEGQVDKNSKFKKIIHFDFVYSCMSMFL